MIYGNKFYGYNINNEEILTEKAKINQKRQHIIAVTKRTLKQLYRENGFNSDDIKIYNKYARYGTTVNKLFLKGKGKTYIYTLESPSTMKHQLIYWSNEHKNEIIEAIQNAVNMNIRCTFMNKTNLLVGDLVIEIKYDL